MRRERAHSGLWKELPLDGSGPLPPYAFYDHPLIKSGKGYSLKREIGVVEVGQTHQVVVLFEALNERVLWHSGICLAFF